MLRPSRRDCQNNNSVFTTASGWPERRLDVMASFQRSLKETLGKVNQSTKSG